MKSNLKTILVFSLFTAMSTLAQNGKVGIGTTSPHSSAELDVSSTTRGFLPPRMTSVQMNDIASPSPGLIVYCLTCSPTGLYVYNSTGWTAISTLAPVTSDCTANGFSGSLMAGVASSGASFSVTITNNSFSAATLSFQNSDLVLSGVSGLSVATTSPTSATLNAGQSQLVTYTISGTPADSGTLTGSWSKLSLSCTDVQTVNSGNATLGLPLSKYIVSTGDGSPAVSLPGFITNTSPNQIVFQVPYTAGSGSYPAYTSSVVTGTAGEGGDTNGFTISYPAGTFSATGTLPVTVTVTGDGSYSVKKKLFGAQEIIATLPLQLNGTTQGNIILGVIGGIPDRMYGVADNTGSTTSHNFIYFPITGPDGRTWLNNNLGARYANTNHASYNPIQQATSATDYLAYGSLFQWGRKADGHDLINHNSASSATPVNGITTSVSDDPVNALFITRTAAPWDWRNTSDNTLWASVSSTNNPCPQGYRVPTSAEWATLITAASITNFTNAASSALKITSSGLRGHNDGVPTNLSSGGYYWTSTVSGNDTTARYFLSTSTLTFNDIRSFGMTVRCIKN